MVEIETLSCAGNASLSYQPDGRVLRTVTGLCFDPETVDVDDYIGTWNVYDEVLDEYLTAGGRSGAPKKLRKRYLNAMRNLSDVSVTGWIEVNTANPASMRRLNSERGEMEADRFYCDFVRNADGTLFMDNIIPILPKVQAGKVVASTEELRAQRALGAGTTSDSGEPATTKRKKKGKKKSEKAPF